ncbi:MAG: ABC transporter ATP-binding protein [Verrucomicrobiales bacterium]|nr:ABC transporter ATP-binding protein [Verrucomicrobiales bacterium]
MQKKSEKISNGPELPIEKEIPAMDFRKESLQLLQESTRDLGWKFKLWIPASMLLASVFLLPPYFLKYFTENLTTLNEVNGSEFGRLLIFYGVIIAICLWVGFFLSGVLAEWLRIQISINLRNDALASLLDSKLERLDEAERGDWMTRMTSDLSSCEDFLSDSLPRQIQNLTILLGSAILFTLHSGWIALIPLVAAVFLSWFNVFAQKKMAPVLSEAREIEGKIFQTIIESFEGIRTIRSFGGEGSVKDHLNRQLQQLKAVGMRIIKIMSGLMGLNEMISQIVITLILTLVAYRVSGESLTVTDALVYPFFINLFLNSAKSLVASAFDWNRFFIEGGRLASVIYDPNGKLDESDELLGMIGAESIGGRGIEVKYGDNPPVISDFDFLVNSGEIVVMKGPSGSGKSTLLEVFSGLRTHSKGELFLSTKHSGAETVPMIPKSICSFVEQQPYLFVGTVRENLKLGNSELFDVEIQSVIKAVGLESVIAHRGGLDTNLGDRGRNWSVGQQYRLALCRALLSRRPFLMLDEPFAALDDESVRDVIKTIELAKKAGSGIVIVTHIMPDDLRPDKVLDIAPELAVGHSE